MNFNNLILVFQNNASHLTLNKVKCEKQILSSVGFEPSLSCVRYKRLTAKLQGPHGRKQHRG